MQKMSNFKFMIQLSKLTSNERGMADFSDG